MADLAEIKLYAFPRVGVQRRRGERTMPAWARLSSYRWQCHYQPQQQAHAFHIYQSSCQSVTSFCSLESNMGLKRHSQSH